jgi:hypothetical protein
MLARVLTHDHVCKLYDAVVSADLAAARDALLAGLDRGLIATLLAAKSPGALIFGDLHALNGMSRLADGSLPLEGWLRNAERLASPRAEAALFVDALARLGGHGPGASAIHGGPGPAAIHEGPGGVPATPVPHFLGRSDEMREFREALAAGAAVCVVATGLGGIGKTSLVRQFVAVEAAAMFPDGSAWIDATNLAADAARVCKRLGYESGRQPTLAEAKEFLAVVLHERRVLVVIDNVWPDKIDVAALPLVGGKSRTVLTSRAPALHESLDQHARPLPFGPSEIVF